MSREQLSTAELLLSLDSLELQEAERVRAAVTQQLSSDRGGAVLSSLVEHFVESSSPQALQLLSCIREPHHKPLLEKLNEVLSRPASRLAAVTLLGHLIRKQPPWVHHVSQAAVLPTLLRLLKTDGDVMVLITGVLVLITLLPMIPQAGRQHIYDFFDVFGRLASWSLKNPGHIPPVQLVHLQASVYSLFHRLYGMFPCNFISYLRLHYSMKENLDTFQEVVRPMLDQVRIHPELVTGTQDDELDPSRWKCYEVHDIIIECSRVSLDPRESSCENSTFCVSPLPPPHLSPSPLQLTDSSLHKQADDVTWSPSSRCGLSTPPPECAAVSSAPPLSRTSSIPDDGQSLSSVFPLPAEDRDRAPPPYGEQMTHRPIAVEEPQSAAQSVTEREQAVCHDVIKSSSSEDVQAGFWPPSPSWSSQSVRTSTPARDAGSAGSLSFCSAPPRPEDAGSATTRPEDGGWAPPYDALFELALPCAATLFMGKKMQGAAEKGGGQPEEQTSISPLELLDQLIVYGHEAHQQLSGRSSACSKSSDSSHVGGKHQSMKLKGSAQEEELQALRSQLLLLHTQLQYERFKRQQHAIRNRRLIRRAISATALEEQSNAMRAQLGVQEEEIRCLKTSLEREQQRYTELQRDTHTHTTQLNARIQQLLQHQQDMQRDNRQLQSELQECQHQQKEMEAELQNTNNKAYNTEHQLTQLSLKLSSSEQLQQQIFILNQQLLLQRETNRILMGHLDGRDGAMDTEASMLQSVVGKEYQRLKDSEGQQRQKLEAANHRAAELETQLLKKDQLLLDLKKLLDDTKDQSRAELAACEARCASLRRIAQTLQTEMLQLYGQIQLATPPSSQLATPPLSATWAAGNRPNGSGGVGAASAVSCPSSVVNGGVEQLSSSPLLLPSPPIDSPLLVGSFLEQRARQLFGPSDQGPDGEAQPQEEEPDEQEEAEPEQEGEWSSVDAGSPHEETASGAAESGGPRRRRELSIMDYDETLPEL